MIATFSANLLHSLYSFFFSLPPLAGHFRTDRYDEDGNCTGTTNCNPPPPTHLKWDLCQDCLVAVDTSFKVSNVNDLKFVNAVV